MLFSKEQIHVLYFTFIKYFIFAEILKLLSQYRDTCFHFIQNQLRTDSHMLCSAVWRLWNRQRLQTLQTHKNKRKHNNIDKNKQTEEMTIQMFFKHQL